MGFVFQHYHLLDELTVAENLELPLATATCRRATAPRWWGIRSIGSSSSARRTSTPASCPAGQQQLVAVARAVIAAPRLLLADEPTGNLHSAQGREIMQLFQRLNAEGVTIVQVTHSRGKRPLRRPGHPPEGRLAHPGVDSTRPWHFPHHASWSPTTSRTSCRPFASCLRNEGFVVDTATSPAAVLAALEDRDFDVLLMDLNYTRDTTSGHEGLDVLARIQLLDGALPTVVMTAYGSVEGAVEAMRRGARDYLEKPWDNNRLVSLLRTQVELGRALRRTQRLESENQSLRREGTARSRHRVACHARHRAPHGTRRPVRCQRADSRGAWQSARKSPPAGCMPRVPARRAR